MKETVNKLRERPKDEKTAVAGGVAVFVVAILLLGWGILFLKRIVSEKPINEQVTPAIDAAAIRDASSAGSYTNSTQNTDPFGQSPSSGSAGY